MKWNKVLQFFLILCISSFTACDSQEQPESNAVELQLPEEEAEIFLQMKSYVNAINQRDSEKVASFWSEEAIYRNPVTGDLVEGRGEIEEQFVGIFDKLGNDAKVEMEIKSIRFPFEEKAVEEGIARLTRPGKHSIERDHKMIYVKKGDKWLILNASRLDLGVLATDAEPTPQ